MRVERVTPEQFAEKFLGSARDNALRHLDRETVWRQRLIEELTEELGAIESQRARVLDAYPQVAPTATPEAEAPETAPERVPNA